MGLFLWPKVWYCIVVVKKLSKDGINMINTPKELVVNKLNEAKSKSEFPIWKILVLGMMAGAFIAIGASSSNLAVHAVSNPGIAKLIAGCIFPVGLMMIVLIGGELFTGDCMVIFGCYDKRISVLSLIKILVLVFVSNMAGSLILAGLVYASGQFDMSAGVLGAYTIKVAVGKVSLPFGRALASGILCNIIVCIAVLFAGAAKDVTGKLFGCFFPIMAFVVGGYEHCVANMYYIPAGMMALTNDSYKQAAIDTYGFTADQLAALSMKGFFINNLIPVTIGNMIGGMIFVALPLYIIHKRDLNK